MSLLLEFETAATLRSPFPRAIENAERRGSVFGAIAIGTVGEAICSM